MTFGFGEEHGLNPGAVVGGLRLAGEGEVSVARGAAVSISRHCLSRVVALDPPDSPACSSSHFSAKVRRNQPSDTSSATFSRQVFSRSGASGSTSTCMGPYTDCSTMPFGTSALCSAMGTVSVGSSKKFCGPNGAPQLGQANVVCPASASSGVVTPQLKQYSAPAACRSSGVAGRFACGCRCGPYRPRSG